MIERRSKWILIILITLIILSVAALFYRSLVTQDFEQAHLGDEEEMSIEEE